MIEGNFFTSVPSRALTDKRLTSDDTRILCQIYMLSNQRGFCWAANTYFANLNDVSVRTIQRCIKKLEELNYIFIETIRETEITNRPFRALIVAEATAPVLIEKLKERTREIEDEKNKQKQHEDDSPSCDRGDTGVTPTHDTGVTPTHDTGVTHNKYNINKYNINKRAHARDNTRSIKKQGANSSFCNFDQRNYDLTQLENAMLRKFLNPNGDDGG